MSNLEIDNIEGMKRRLMRGKRFKMSKQTAPDVRPNFSQMSAQQSRGTLSMLVHGLFCF
jgi:hypothetical protein